MPGVLRLAVTKAFRKSALLFETFEYQYKKGYNGNGNLMGFVL